MPRIALVLLVALLVRPAPSQEPILVWEGGETTCHTTLDPGVCPSFKGGLTLRARVRMHKLPRHKAGIVGRWRTVPGGRSFELGVFPDGKLFFTASASGDWPREAREIRSPEPIPCGELLEVGFSFDPHRSMKLLVNGAVVRATCLGVPGPLFPADLPIHLGFRAGDPRHTFDGHIMRLWIVASAVEGGAPPPAPPWNLDEVRAATRPWAATLHVAGKPCGAYALRSGQKPDLYASADLAWIRWMCDDLELTPSQRREWLDFIASCQKPDGGYRHGTGHCATHAFCHATGAVKMLGGSHRRAPILLERYRKIENIPAWLEGIDWKHPWGASHDIWGAGLPIACSSQTPQGWRKAFFEWLDAEVDPDTGYWRKGIPTARLLEGLGGAFHIWPIYAALGRSLPLPAKIIDSTLSLQQPDGSFDGGFGYGHMDAIWVLAHLMPRVEHRRAEVRSALERATAGLMEIFRYEPARFLSDAHGTESRIASLAICYEVLPQLFESSHRWRNPWSRRELFAITLGGETKEKLLRVCEKERYSFTPQVREAFLSYAKTRARSELAARGIFLPEEFLAWIDSDPEVEASAYGAHRRAADVLLWLYSLRLDLGRERFEKYRQLALAAAIVSVQQDLDADITPRKPLKLVIPGDPRRRVDTKEPGRKLDLNDHIINFLDENKIVAADVLASKALQEKFNACMKAKGETVRIDCGERIVHWKSHNMVRGEQRKRINAAFLLFRKAYEAKGLLPAKRDPFPSPAERCAYLIRNHEHVFPPETQAKRKWPLFPLTAPWPVLTMLVADNQPLREREERWIAFRDKGEFRKYGEYIGSVAQQYDMQSARRLKPFPYTYGSIQMMFKDGGVCGAMASISARSHNILGIPASTAAQPGHCALVAFGYDPRAKTFHCRGQQYVTGGDDKTTPHTPWFFGDEAKKVRKPMVYHQSIAWAVNCGLRSYLDSTMACAVFRLLPETDRRTRGMRLLESGLGLNPYNFLLVGVAQAAADTPQEQIRFWRTFKTRLAEAAGKPGCPVDGLYERTVKSKMFQRIAQLAVPEKAQEARDVLAFLEREACDRPAALAAYRLALEGLPALLSRTERDFKKHVLAIQARVSGNSDKACAKMAAMIRATAACIKNGKQKQQWALVLWEQARGHEKYFGKKYRVATHPALPWLARLCGRKLPPESELIQPMLERVRAELGKSVQGRRSIKTCRELAAMIKSAAQCIADPNQKRPWLEGLARIIKGRETFRTGKGGKKAEVQRDPCADAIEQLVRSLPGAG